MAINDLLNPIGLADRTVDFLRCAVYDAPPGPIVGDLGAYLGVRLR